MTGVNLVGTHGFRVKFSGESAFGDGEIVLTIVAKDVESAASIAKAFIGVDRISRMRVESIKYVGPVFHCDVKS